MPNIVGKFLDICLYSKHYLSVTLLSHSYATNVFKYSEQRQEYYGNDGFLLNDVSVA